MKNVIEEVLARIINEIGVSDIFPHVDIPDDPKNGEFTTTIAMMLSKRLHKPPMQIAQDLKDRIIQDQSITKVGGVARVEIAPPGFINFYLSEASFINELSKVLKDKNLYGKRENSALHPIYGVTRHAAEAKNDTAKIGDAHGQKTPRKPDQKIEENSRTTASNAEKTDSPAFPRGMKSGIDSRKEGIRHVMIEFADPNPFKEFHIGHLRNISLGESYCRLVETTGDEVRRVNYQGDVGMHVAKSLWGLQQINKLTINKLTTPQEKAQLLGKAYAAGAQAFEDESAEGEKAKQEIIALNKKVYAQDPTIIDIWKQGRQWSLDYFDTIYDRLGTKFTRFYFESEVAPIGMKLVMDHIADGVFEESDGAVIFRGEAEGLHTRVFVSKEKYATYEAKDLALAPLKYSEYPYDLSIIMTGNEQSPYFSVMLAALKKINPELAAKTRHMPFGMVNLKEGKMSSRTGNVITAEWLIDQAKEKIVAILANSAAEYTEEERRQISEKAAIGAVKYSMLKVGATSDIAFDLDASVAFDGDSGPYLQYTYARCKSVLRKADNLSSSGLTRGSISEKLDSRLPFEAQGKRGNDIVVNEEERLIIRLISQFPYVVADAAEHFAPNTVATYLFHLAQQFNVFYANQTIVGNDLRLAITAGTAQVIQNGLYLLGIETLERM